MQNTTIVIQSDGEVFSNKPINLTDATSVLLTGLLTVAAQINKEVPEDKQVEFKETTYDMFNTMFTAFLETWIPDSELREDIAADAIMELENQKLTQATERLMPDDTVPEVE